MRKLQLFTTAAALLATTLASAANYTGTVTWVEVWRIGNVAFRLSDPASAAGCNGNGTFILNATDAGAKNLYAALLAAKKTGTVISVSSGACVSADYTGGGNVYMIVDYLYL